MFDVQGRGSFGYYVNMGKMDRYEERFIYPGVMTR